MVLEGNKKKRIWHSYDGLMPKMNKKILYLDMLTYNDENKGDLHFWIRWSRKLVMKLFVFFIENYLNLNEL